MDNDFPPLAIELMLRCYYSSEPHEHESWESSAGKQWHSALYALGLIDEDSEATEKGRAWVLMILSTPLPVKTWIDPRTKELVGGKND